MTNIYGKGDRGKATRLHAMIVRGFGSCQRCGSTHALQCAHIISRKYGNTRTDLNNAFCLCASCHMYFTDNPVDFGTFTINEIGEDAYGVLLERRQLTSKVDWKKEAMRLNGIARERGLI
jgi:hypothetical protein